jgi:hypothetical protein
MPNLARKVFDPFRLELLVEAHLDCDFPDADSKVGAPFIICHELDPPSFPMR